MRKRVQKTFRVIDPNFKRTGPVICTCETLPRTTHGCYELNASEPLYPYLSPRSLQADSLNFSAINGGPFIFRPYGCKILLISYTGIQLKMLSRRRIKITERLTNIYYKRRISSDGHKYLRFLDCSIVSETYVSVRGHVLPGDSLRR